MEAETITKIAALATGAMQPIDLGTPMPAVVLRDGSIHSIEKYHLARARMRGTYSTDHIESFVRYVQDNSNSATVVFVHTNNGLQAVSVFNLGTSENPGHADWTARLALNMVTSFADLNDTCNGARLSQKELAEFVEDHANAIAFQDRDGGYIATSQAIAAIRDMTITAKSEKNVQVQEFSGKRSSMEEIEAKSKGSSTPAAFTFMTETYHGLKNREIFVRISAVTSGDDLAFTARIVGKEQLEEDIKEEFRQVVSDRIQGAEVLIGSFTP